ncbi:MAG: hypothetical protein FJ344_08310 [Sphingomonadales bacterium]|nr:hypothetical protein [Sphingomonadales bacterium]
MKLRTFTSVFSFLLCLSGISACSDPDTIDYPRPSYTDSAAAAANGSIQSNPILNPTAQQTAANGPAPKINPPHGQPGHRCDIAVGAPLDGSAPAPKVVSTPTVTQSPVQLTPQVTQVSTSDATQEPTPEIPAPDEVEQPAKSDDSEQKPANPEY